MNNPEPDYDELLIRLSLYVFNRLSPSDQREQVEEICSSVNAGQVQFLEESDEAFRLRAFAELFRKLNFSDQLKLFLSKVVQKFKHERQLGELISSFKQLDAEHQQELIEKIVHVTPENRWNPEATYEYFRLRRLNCFTTLILLVSRVVNKFKRKMQLGECQQQLIEQRVHEAEEDFRVGRFTQLCRDHTDKLYKSLVSWKDSTKSEEDDENSFAEFFLGFSTIWFQGQSASGQDLLIEQLSKGLVIDQKHDLQDKTEEEDFKLRRFTELCKKVADIRVQEEFLHNAERKLEQWGEHLVYRLISEPQDSDSAAELLSRLTTFGFSLLSAEYQQQRIDEMSNAVEGLVAAAEDQTSIDHEEDFRMTRFKELFNRVPVRKRIELFNGLRKKLQEEKLYSEAVRFFRGLGSEDQTEMIEKLSGQIMKYQRGDPAEPIIERFSGESEEDFRLRRFKKVCIKYVSIRGDIVWPKAYRERVGQGTSEESSPYASFLFGVSIIWYKARCANYGRNPIHVILFGQVDQFRDHVIEKLPLPEEESEEDFRLRRFTESFKRLEFTFQERIVYYIQDTLFSDLGYPVLYITPCSASVTPEGRGSFDPAWIKMKLPHLQDLGAAAATTQGETSQAAAGGKGQPSASAT
ncbi:hypothetical protein M0R45_004318 [Rubus argutus]